MSEFVLKQDDQIVETLRVHTLDQTYFYCKFEATEAFQPFKSFFEEELKLLNDEDFEVWDKFYNQITNFNLKIVKCESEEFIEDFILHIQNDEAWFRY